MKALLIINPAAGQGKRALASDAVHDAFREIDPEIYLTQTIGDAERTAEVAAASGRYDCVIAAGGDGTVNEAATGVLKAWARTGIQVPLGIVPLGTQNVLAGELGLPAASLHDLAAVVKTGRTRRIDVGRINDRYFLLMAGLGFDAAVVRDIQRPIKELIGPAAYAFATLAALTKYRSTSMKITLDGEVLTSEVFLLVVANAASYAYRQVKIAPFASLDDGWLDLCIFERPPTDRIGFATQVAALFAGRHLRDPRVRYYRAREIRIDSDPSVGVQLDGDSYTTTPVSISAVPRGLSVFVP
jgi:YegS/Rv2252/BmrU family lipid kinase